jgi:hypothetical protein
MSWFETRASRVLRVRCLRSDDGTYTPTHGVVVGPALCDLHAWAVWAVYDTDRSRHPIKWGQLGQRVPAGSRFVLPTEVLEFGPPPDWGGPVRR